MTNAGRPREHRLRPRFACGYDPHFNRAAEANGNRIDRLHYHIGARVEGHAMRRDEDNVQWQRGTSLLQPTRLPPPPKPSVLGDGPRTDD
jgi:hypothetical protein